MATTIILATGRSRSFFCVKNSFGYEELLRQVTNGQSNYNIDKDELKVHEIILKFDMQLKQQYKQKQS
jgi:hypothetical protein